MEKRYSCPYCDQTSAKTFNIKRHIENQHPTENAIARETPSFVQQTPEEFDSMPSPNNDAPANVNIPLDPERRFKCPLCQMVFTKRFNLRRHQTKRHASKLKSVTSSKIGSTPKDAIIHSTEKRFVCEVCSEEFTRRFNLRRHLARAHTSDGTISKTIFCYLCPQFTCNQLKKLVDHAREVHQIPTLNINETIEGAENFKNIIAEFCQHFPSTRKLFLGEAVRNSSQNDRIIKYRCKFSTELLVGSSSSEPRQSPCTFHFTALKSGSTYKITGCGTHFGHQVGVDTRDVFNRFRQNGHSTTFFCTQDTPISQQEIADIFDDFDDAVKSESPPLTSSNDFLLNRTVDVKNELNEDGDLSMDGIKDFVSDSFVGSSQMLSTQSAREYIEKLQRLEEIEPDVFRTNFLCNPTGRKGNAYGGLLFAQSLRAAQLTVNRNQFMPHAMHTFFILNVDSTGHCDYKIQRVRDGKSYATRYVNALQNGKIVMSSQVSLCVREDSSIEHQIRMPQVPLPENLQTSVEFARNSLDKYERGEIELAQITIRYLNHVVSNANESIFETRPIDPTKYYGLERAEGIQPFYFWVKAQYPLSNDPDEHRFLIAFISDATLASAANRLHSGRGYVPSMVLSLDHSVRWHNEARADEWLLYENVSPWAKSGRALSEGRLWKRDGTLVLSVSQESLSRTRGEPSHL